jgi:hypothetical protein
MAKKQLVKEWAVVLYAKGNRTEEVETLVAAAAQLQLNQARKLVDSAPSRVKRALSKQAAKQLAAELNALEAVAHAGRLQVLPQPGDRAEQDEAPTIAAIGRMAQVYYQRGNVSMFTLFGESGYLEGAARITEARLEALLRAHPTLMDA